MLRKLSYRPDIDGLRALAVISVILFHINPNYMPSGFLGVDIFFVISGFLITSIIYKEMAEGTFSFANFYNRRIKRILPVFFIVLIVGLLIVWWLFLERSYYEVGNSAIASILFLSNIYFSRGSGYFDINTEEKPFNHIWSLSVEEQFYFIFPLILLFIFKNKFLKNHKIGTLVGGGGILLLLSFINLQKIGLSLDSYYLPHLRMIELLVGSILSVFLLEKGNSLSKTQSNFLGIFSVLLLLICFYLKDFFILPYFPGILSLLPCILVAMLILANEKGLWIKSFFSLGPIVWLGKLSYSLYLWHWIVLAVLRYTFGTGEIVIINPIMVLLLILTLSVITYYFVEQPLRVKKYNFKKSITVFYIIPLIIVLFICVGMYKTPVPECQKPYTDYLPLKCNKCSEGKDFLSTIGDQNSSVKKKILLVGDSHTSHIVPFIDIIGKNEKWKSSVLSSAGCPSIIGLKYNTPIKTLDSDCEKMSNFLKDNYLDYDVFILSNSYLGEKEKIPNIIEQLKSTIQELLNRKKVIYLINSCIRFDFDLQRVEKFQKNIGTLQKLELKGNKFKDRVKEWECIKEDIKHNFPQVHFVDIKDYISNDGYIEGIPILYDSNHINAYGAKKIAEQFIKDGKRLIREEDLK
ncbi:acyltransferase family protein [Capnocytophaga sputigena]|uniref:acyltransferase family protein n=1 Tax=Capnocytophaga sputigena TaxID=1019 RepID=UPI000BB1CBE3|nr:acyltransferase family protein [Capnocytophaga sputigena]ATA70197.1 acyltransferase [Capnocytophaga sputigena]